MKSHYKSTQMLIKELQTEWTNHKIPREIQSIYLEAFQKLSKPKLHKFLSQEIFCYESDSSLILICLQSILAQNESITSIKTLGQTLENTKNWNKIEEIVIECSEIFEAYRNLTIDLVENIISWKKQMKKELHSFDVDLFYSGRSYLEVLRTMMDFLLDSEFSKVFHFVSNDPFLVKCSKIVNTSQNFIIFKNQYFLTITVELYERIAFIEESLLKIQNSQSLNLSNEIPVKKSEKENENKIRTPIRSNSNQKISFKVKKNKRESSQKAIYKPKTEFKYINQLLDSQLQRVDESCVESDDIILPSKKHKLKRHKLNHLQENEEFSDISESLALKDKKSWISGKRLPPLVNPHVKYYPIPNSETGTLNRELKTNLGENQSSGLRSKNQRSELIQEETQKKQKNLPINLKKTDEEIEKFLELERMIEKGQIAEEIVAALIKHTIKKVDLYSLAYDELNNANTEGKIMRKQEHDKEVSREVCDSLVEFFINNCFLEDLTKELIYNCRKNISVGTNIAENIDLSDYILHFILTSFMTCINFEELVEECINSSLRSSIKDIYSLPKSHITEENQNEPIFESIFSDFLSFLLSSLISSALQEFQDDLNFESLTSEKILSENFSEIAIDKSNINILLYSQAKFTDSEIRVSENIKKIIEVSSRPIVIGAILQKYSECSHVSNRTRLQTDLIDLLNIYSKLPDTDRPPLSNKFVASFQIPHTAIQNSSSSFFLLRNIPIKISDSSAHITIQSSNPSFSLFFIKSSTLLHELHSELDLQDSDLYSKVVSILNSEPSKVSFANVLVPFFFKHLTCRVPWMQGLKLSESSQISECIESFYVHFSCNILQTETVPLPSTILSPPFIFGIDYLGLIHNSLYSSLKIPMAVCLVNSHDVIRN